MSSLALSLLLLLVARADTAFAAETQSNASSAAIDRARAIAVPLVTTAPGSGLADLQPIRKAIGGARLVALGDATHGTREATELKHRLVELLVTQERFNLLLLEAPFPACAALNDYVLHGRGDAATALHGQGFWMWDTEEMLSLVQWLRRHNQSALRARTVEIHCLDAKSETASLTHVFAYLTRVAPTVAARVRAPLALLFTPQQFYPVYFKYGPAERETLQHDLQRLIDVFDTHRRELVAASDAREWDLARQHAVVLKQTLDFYGEVQAESAVVADPGYTTLNYRLWHSAEGVGSVLARHAPALLTETTWLWTALQDNFRDVARRYRDEWSAEQRRHADEAAARIGVWIDAQRESPTSGLSNWTESSRQAADVQRWLRGQRARLEQPTVPRRVREQAMADNALWALDRSGPAARAVIWTHNFHASYEPISIFEDETMAGILKARVGRQLVTMGFSGHGGSFRAEYYPVPEVPTRRRPELRAFAMPAPAAQSADAVLNQVGPPLFALDLRRLAGQPWFTATHKLRHFGSGFNELWERQSYENVRLAASFDLLIFIRASTPSRINPLTRAQYASPDGGGTSVVKK